MTSPNGNIFRVTGHLCGEFSGHRRIPCTNASDAQLIINGWVSNGAVGDLRRHRAHYDVSVMEIAMNPHFQLWNIISSTILAIVCQWKALSWTDLAQLMDPHWSLSYFKCLSTSAGTLLTEKYTSNLRDFFSHQWFQTTFCIYGLCKKDVLHC